MIVDLFAGPGGWDLGARLAGLPDPLGVEFDAAACATRAAAGLRTAHADVSALDPRAFPAAGLLASPPCPAFSKAGKREGIEHIPALIAAIHSGDWAARPSEDPRVWLALEVGRWVDALYPRWVACEQVPEALPLWEAYARILGERGYSTWTGVLEAERYGVPQTRERAFLMASLDRRVQPPEPTHQRYVHGQPAAHEVSLLGELLPWVSMAEALGWEGEDAPARTLAGARQPRWMYADQDGNLVLNTGRDWKPGGTRDDAQKVPISAPAPALSAKAGGQWFFERPATTVTGDQRLWPPGHKINADDARRLGAEAAEERYGDRRGSKARKLTIAEALILQSFPGDYPVQGSKTKQFEQVGNAVPPLLAAAVLRCVAQL